MARRRHTMKGWQSGMLKLCGTLGNSLIVAGTVVLLMCNTCVAGCCSRASSPPSSATPSQEITVLSPAPTSPSPALPSGTRVISNHGDEGSSQAATTTPVSVGSTSVEPARTPSATQSPVTSGDVERDADGFLLEVWEPLDGSVVSSTEVYVDGTTLPGAIVSVNGRVVDVDDSGGFTTVVRLDEGPNRIEVIASDAEGREKAVILAIVSIP